MLRLHIEGVEELGGDVRLTSFLDKLAALKAALAETENLLPDGKKPAIDYLVTNLSHSSPAMVELTAVPTDGTGDPAAVVDYLLDFVSGAKERRIPPSSRQARLVDHVRKLVAGSGERYQRLWLDGPGHLPVVLDKSLEGALDFVLPEVRREIGVVKGIVKRYTGIGARLYFKIVPPGSNEEVKCFFSADLLPKAAASVEHNTTVQGELKFYEGDLLPHEVKVLEITIHPGDDELPTLSSLAGTAPNLTGDLDVAEFVRELRNEW